MYCLFEKTQNIQKEAGLGSFKEEMYCAEPKIKTIFEEMWYDQVWPVVDVIKLFLEEI